MEKLVLKFGGTSLKDIASIRLAAQRVFKKYNEGNNICVVASAMGDSTNQLVNLIKDNFNNYDFAEYDSIVSTGEQVAAGMLVLALQELSLAARSFQAWQVPILTDNKHTKAKISSIDTAAILKCFSKKEICVIGGFQGITNENRLTTLGRGGSDTSAVLLACALKAKFCEIFTDVDGVYSADPRICKKAHIIKQINYEEMLELSSAGAKILHTRSVAAAYKYNLPLIVRSTFNQKQGTLITNIYKDMENRKVTAIAHKKDEAIISLRNVADTPGIAHSVFLPLAEAGIFVDMIIQGTSYEHTDKNRFTNITFSVNKDEVKQALKIINNVISNIKSLSKIAKIITRDDLAKVSIIGIGMSSQSGVAAEMFGLLSKKNINVIAISTSEIKVSVLVENDYVELAVRTLHNGFQLDTK